MGNVQKITASEVRKGDTLRDERGNGFVVHGIEHDDHEGVVYFDLEFPSGMRREVGYEGICELSVERA